MPAFDHLYEAAATFEEVYAGIVEALVAAATEAAPEPVVYAVPGSPLVAERSVELLRADGRVEVTVLPALSFLDLAWAALGIDPLAEGGAPGRRRGVRLRRRATAVRSWWRSAGRATSSPRSSSASVTRTARRLPRPVLLHHLGLEDEVVAAVDWWDLDRTVEPDHLTSLYIPALGVGRRRRPPAQRWSGWSPSWRRCANAAPGTGPRPMRH